MIKEPKNYNTDLTKLYELSKKLKGVKVTFRNHPLVTEEPGVKDLIGYYPTGDKQILFKKGRKELSCIRGTVSFGYFEIYDGKNCDRYETEQEVIDAVMKKFKL